MLDGCTPSSSTTGRSRWCTEVRRWAATETSSRTPERRSVGPTELGFRYFETDVRTTRDGVLVACHDHSLRRVAGERVRIADVTWAELVDTPVGDEPLPRLVDLLDEYPDVSFNIDPKVDAAVRPLVTVAARQWRPQPDLRRLVQRPTPLVGAHRTAGAGLHRGWAA